MNKFDLIKEYVSVLLGSDDTPALIIKDKRGGIGKTYEILECLKEHKLKQNKDFVYVNGQITPLALFKTLSRYQSKIIVMDDIEGVLSNKISLYDIFSPS